MYATYERVQGRPTLEFERDFPHPASAVWEAITRPSELAQWFPSAVDGEIRVGGKLKFTFAQMPLPDGPMTLAGEVTELEPMRRFSFLWGEDHLHFVLEPTADRNGCRLRFTVELDSRDKAARDGAGWHVCLDALERLLAGGALERPHDSGQWQDHYAEYQRRGFPSGAVVPGGEV